MLRRLSVLMLVLAAGCRNKPVPPAPTFDGLVSRVTALLQAGNTNAALAELDVAATNAAFASERGSIFQNMLSLRLRSGGSRILNGPATG